MVELKAIEPASLSGAPQIRFSALREGEIVKGVPALQIADVVLLGEPLLGELPDRLQHREAVGRATNEVFVEERCERDQIGVADCLGRVQRTSAGEDGEPPE